MKAEELRLGNLCIEKYTKEIIKVVGLEPHRVVFSSMFLTDWQALPIPLTKEWAAKLGFKNNQIEIQNKYVYFCIDIDGIKYVHQLQNLYFALTGKELEICVD